MYFDKASAELSREEMEQVRTTFAGLLYKQRYHRQFIAKNLDDLLGIAHLEYTRYAEKEEIEDPVAWTVHCAYRRLQNLLTRTNYSPREVSSEILAELADEDTPTPDQIAEDMDRARKVRRAVEKLDVEQRQLLALIYFEDQPLAEAARRLGWHESRAWRLHREATKRLKALLGVESIDELAIEVGLAAWFTLAGSYPPHLPPGFEAVLDKAGHGASGIWSRAQDLGRRLHLLGGGDAASAMASTDSGSNVATCLKAAAICIAGASVVVHSAGGGLGAHHDSARSARPHVIQAQQTNESAGQSPTSTAEVTEEAAANPTGAETNPHSSSAAGAEASQSPKAQASSEKRQVRERMGGFARASRASGTVSTPQQSSSGTASASSAAPETASEPASSSSSSGGSGEGSQQFGAFK